MWKPTLDESASESASESIIYIIVVLQFVQQDKENIEVVAIFSGGEE